MFKTLFLALGIALAVLVLYLWYLGLFAPVRVQTVTAGPYVLIGKNMQGDYAQTGRVIDQMYTWLRQKQLAPTRGFGLYLDDPRKTATAQLRSVVGNVLESQDQAASLALEHGYKRLAFPAMTCLQVELPYRNKGSIFIGILRAYPVLLKHAAAQGIQQPVMELYDPANHRVRYLMPAQPPLDLARTFYGEEPR